MNPTEQDTKVAADAFKDLLTIAANTLPVSETNKLAAYISDVGLKSFFITAKHLALEARANTGNDQAYGEMMAALHNFIEAKLTETLRQIFPGITVRIDLERPSPQPLRTKLALVPPPPPEDLPPIA